MLRQGSWKTEQLKSIVHNRLCFCMRSSRAPWIVCNLPPREYAVFHHNCVVAAFLVCLAIRASVTVPANAMTALPDRNRHTAFQHRIDYIYYGRQPQGRYRGPDLCKKLMHAAVPSAYWEELPSCKRIGLTLYCKIWQRTKFNGVERTEYNETKMVIQFYQYIFCIFYSRSCLCIEKFAR